MKHFNQYSHGSIASQFFRASSTTALIAILLLTIGATLVASHALRQQQVQHINSVATLMSVQAQAAVLFEDKLNAREMIESLASDGNIHLVELRLSSGEVLARYEQTESGTRRLLDRIVPRIKTTRDIHIDNQAIGHLELEGSNTTLLSAVMGLIIFDLLASALCLALSIALALRYSRQILAPLGKLQKAMRGMIASADHKANVPPFHVQELDELGSQFNQLLDQLERRDRDLMVTNNVLAEMAFRDALTGLPNRAMFEIMRMKAIRNAHPENARLGMLYLDLDHFKSINDSHGHEAGDEILRVLSRRLQDWQPEGAIVARRGGDEFIVLWSKPPAAEEIEPAIRRLRELLEAPILVGAKALNPKISVGWAIYPDTVTSLDELTVAADQAMYANKAQRHSTPPSKKEIRT